MLSMALSVKDARGEPLEAIVEWVKDSTGLKWTAALWSNGYPVRVVSGGAKRYGEIPRSLQEEIIFSGLRIPMALVA